MQRDILACFDSKKYAKLAFENKKSYIENKPFPHIVFDNFLPSEMALALASEYPSVENEASSWKYHKNQNVDRHFVEDSRAFGENLRLFANALNSRSFLLFGDFDGYTFTDSRPVFYWRWSNGYRSWRIFKRTC